MTALPRKDGLRFEPFFNTFSILAWYVGFSAVTMLEVLYVDELTWVNYLKIATYFLTFALIFPGFIWRRPDKKWEKALSVIIAFGGFVMPVWAFLSMHADKGITLLHISIYFMGFGMVMLSLLTRDLD